MKRQRGRGRKPGGGGHHHHGGGNNQNPNRAMESSGPEGGKVRGPAAVIHERYLQLARDAASSGDRVLSENYLQHADHYFRLVRQMQPAAPPPQQQQDRFANEQEFDGEEEGGQETEAEALEGVEASSEGDDQPDVEFPQGQQQQFDRGGDGEGRRRRGRRNRFRSDSEREGGEARESGDEQRAERSERPEGETRRERGPRNEEGREGGRRERQPREDREQAGPEGFSNGPKPAFLRSGD